MIAVQLGYEWLFLFQFITNEPSEIVRLPPNDILLKPQFCIESNYRFRTIDNT